MNAPNDPDRPFDAPPAADPRRRWRASDCPRWSGNHGFAVFGFGLSALTATLFMAGMLYLDRSSFAGWSLGLCMMAGVVFLLLNLLPYALMVVARLVAERFSPGMDGLPWVMMLVAAGFAQWGVWYALANHIAARRRERRRVVGADGEGRS